MKAVDISHNYPELYRGKIIEAASLTKNDPNLVVFAFIAGNAKEYLNDKRKYSSPSENSPINFLKQKEEQLQLLGFHPITV